MTIWKRAIQKSGVGKSDRLVHELLALNVVVVGNKREGIDDQGGQLSIFMGFTALGHLNTGIGTSALVAQDGARELEEGVLHGGHTPSIPTANGLDTLL